MMVVSEGYVWPSRAARPNAFFFVAFFSPFKKTSLSNCLYCLITDSSRSFVFKAPGIDCPRDNKNLSCSASNSPTGIFRQRLSLSVSPSASQ